MCLVKLQKNKIYEMYALCFAYHSAQLCVIVYSKPWNMSTFKSSGSGNQKYILAGKKSISSGILREDIDDNTLK